MLGRLAQALGVNSVPVAGMFGEGWSQGTALAIYWIEGLLVIGFIAVRVILHRRWTKKAGHVSGRVVTTTRRNGKTATRTSSGTLLGGYLVTAIPFTLAHGLFLGIILFLFLPKEFGPQAGVSLADLKLGLLGVLFFLILGLVIDLISLKDKSFRWIELLTQRALGRIFVVHLTIIFGMGALAFFHAPAAFFLVFAGLKLLVDLGSVMPHRELDVQPPRWAKHLDKIKSAGGETFSENWKRTELEQRRLREANEAVLHES